MLTPLDIIKELQRSYQIELGGSRRMHQKLTNGELASYNGFDGPRNMVLTNATDHDFYATYSEHLLEALRAGGFTYTVSCCDSSAYMLDTEAVCILECDNVQIVLRKDANFYKKVFDNIDLTFYIKYLWKSSPLGTVVRKDIQPIFEMLFNIARASQVA